MAGEPKVDPSNPDSWEPGRVVAERSFKTDATGKTQIALPQKPQADKRRVNAGRQRRFRERRRCELLQLRKALGRA